MDFGKPVVDLRINQKLYVLTGCHVDGKTIQLARICACFFFGKFIYVV